MKQYLEDMGLLYEQWGAPPMAGKIYGWLLICDPPHQDADRIAEATGGSKASISSNLRLLIQSGMVEKIALPGERKSNYRLKPNAWAEMLKSMVIRLREMKRAAESGLKLLDGEPAERKTRLKEMRAFYAFMEKEFPRMVDKFQ